VCRKITHNAGKQAAISSKKGADKSRACSQLKAGENVSVSQVHDLRGVLDREKADIGVLMSMEQRGGKPMLKEVAEAGFYKSPRLEDKGARMQILTVEQLLGGEIA
jgi:site-specific DNA-methyltransferase (adenine-specific)